jgi:hypothetical protein
MLPNVRTTGQNCHASLNDSRLHGRETCIFTIYKMLNHMHDVRAIINVTMRLSLRCTALITVPNRIHSIAQGADHTTFARALRPYYPVRRDGHDGGELCMLGPRFMERTALGFAGLFGSIIPPVALLAEMTPRF